MTYDCFMLFNELDLLEIRLNLLEDHVDYFLIGESSETFSGKPKPLYFLENEDRFKRWASKIIRVEIEPCKFPNAFERAAYQKDSLRATLMKRPARDEDIVYFGDLDEIWKPQRIDDDKVYNLQQLNYCYYLNNRSSENWVGTIVGKWKTIKTQTFNHWRATHTNELPDGGWHFTNMGGADQIRLKLDAYDHQEFNNEDIRSDIEEKMKYGEDYAGRQSDWQGKPFVFHTDDIDLPKFITDNKERYNHLWK